MRIISFIKVLMLLTLFNLTFTPAAWAQKRPKQPPVSQRKVDFIWVEKSKSRLYLIKNDKVHSSYKVAFGANPIGHKVQEGDERTPEGRYFIVEKRTYSQFYKALLVSYPSAEDKARARKRGVNPGGNILVHGIPNSYAHLPDFIQDFQKWLNWTDGCIAVTNREMDQIFSLVHPGMLIIIRP